MRTIVDPAADFVPACRRIFGEDVRILDGSRAVLVGDVKLSLEAGERELWLVRRTALALEQWLAMVPVRGDIEAAVRGAKELMGAETANGRRVDRSFQTLRAKQAAAPAKPARPLRGIASDASGPPSWERRRKRRLGDG